MVPVDRGLGRKGHQIGRRCGDQNLRIHLGGHVPVGDHHVDRPAGGCAIVHSDSDEGIQRLNQEAAKAMLRGNRAGLDIPPERAIRWITYNAAKSLGVHEQTGSIESGKMADVVLWNQDPFSVYAKPMQVYIDGVLRYEQNNPSLSRSLTSSSGN